MDDPEIIITERRGPGRPKGSCTPDRRVPASMRLPEQHYDRVARIAMRNGTSVAKTLEKIVDTHFSRRRTP